MAWNVKDTAFGQVKFEFMQVTPELAGKWLKRNVKNRRVKPKTIGGYAMDIRNGAWLTTHQGIAFDASGNLLDGQHRLLAIVAAKMPVVLVVSTEWPVAMDPKHLTMDAVDRGITRSLADQLHLQHGVEPKEAGTVVKICNGIAGLCLGMRRVPKSSTDSILTVFGLYKQEIQWLQNYPAKQYGIRQTLLSACVMAKAVFPGDRIDDFMNRLVTGENLTRESPILPLRNWLINSAQRDIRSGETGHIICHHLFAFLENKPCGSLVTNSDIAYKKLLEMSRAKVQKIRTVYQEMVMEFAGEPVHAETATTKATPAPPKTEPKKPEPVQTPAAKKAIESGSGSDLPAGSLQRKVYYEALKAPTEFTASSLAVSLGCNRDSVGVTLVQLDRKGLVKRTGEEDGETVYSLK